MYRRMGTQLEVLIVHPGGPFWAKKDKGAWSIPKGEYVEGEEGMAAAKREFQEEIGQPAPDGEYVELGMVKTKSNKVIHAWAVEATLDVSVVKSNTIQIEWPPRSGQQQEFPEVDKAGWFAPEKAIAKLNPAQVAFIERLQEHLGIQPQPQPEQTSLL